MIKLILINVECFYTDASDYPSYTASEASEIGYCNNLDTLRFITKH